MTKDEESEGEIEEEREGGKRKGVESDVTRGVEWGCGSTHVRTSLACNFVIIRRSSNESSDPTCAAGRTSTPTLWTPLPSFFTRNPISV